MEKEETLKEVKKEEKVKAKKSKNADFEKLQNEYNLLNDKFLRTFAEMQNVKRRSEEEISRVRRYEAEGFIVKLLDIVDDFERAISVKSDNLDTKKFMDGFEMIYAALIGIIHAQGVTEIICLDEEFNPEIAQAVLTEKLEDKKEGIVIDVLQKGYIYNGKVIRPAMVKVSE